MAQNSWSTADYRYMALAIQLAKRGLFTTDPNPRVGCVLVNKNADGRDEIVGQGFHVRAGEGHAEVNAIADAGDRAKGATAYVTLEPCSHYGRTPPCATALVDAGIQRVVAAMQDPNPQVAGRGFGMLQDAGIAVSHGLMSTEAEELNPGFIKRMQTGLPYIRIKMAVSVDGRTAMSSGESQWITGPKARSDVQKLRARSSAVLSGIGTVLFDDASLTVRESELQIDNANEAASKQPLRVVLDSSAKLPPSAKLLDTVSPILWVVSEEANVNDLVAHKDHVDVARLIKSDLDSQKTRPLKPLLEVLAGKECNEVLVEAGATLAGEFIKQALWDELVIYMAPKLMGSEGRPLLKLEVDDMSEAITLNLKDLRMVGSDIRMIYRRSNG